jgi:hypothetical protein
MVKKTPPPLPIKPASQQGTKIPKKAGASAQPKIKTMQKMHMSAFVPEQLSAQDLSSVAMMIACPGSVGTERWSSEYSTKPTAVASPFEVVPVDFGQTGGTYAQMSSAETLGILYRSAARSTVLYDQNSLGLSKSYDAQILNGNTSSLSQSPEWLVYSGTTTYPTIGQWLATSGYNYQPHGPVIYSGSVMGQPGSYVWCDDGDQLSSEMSSNVTSTFEYGVDEFSVRGKRPAQNEATVALTANTPQVLTLKSPGAGTAGYYAPYFRNTGSSTATLTFSYKIYGGGSCFAHRSMPQLAGALPSIEGMRILGASLMYSNTSNILNRGGEIVGYQAGNQENWFDYVSTSSSFAIVSQNADSTTKRMDNGLFGSSKPVQFKDFDYLDEFDYTASGQLIGSHYSLDRASTFLIIVANCTTPAGCLGYWTPRFAVEFMTVDSWRQIAKARMSPEVFKQALLAVRDIEQFYENPIHLSEIWNKIKGFAETVAEGVIKYAPTAVSIASKVLPLVSAL